MSDPMIVKSDEARTRFRELLDHAERGGEVQILRYQRPVAVMTSPDPDPNSLDRRLLAMAAILRETGEEDAADEIGVSAAFIREALRGSDDRDVAEALDLIADYARDLAKTVRAHPSAASEADMSVLESDT
jgi:antitoxin (DNA-binding transcriptional repressor) of toxin-antitoxin stability system